MNRSFIGFLNTHFIPLQNEPSPILVGPKHELNTNSKALGFWVLEHVTFQESGCNIDNLNE